jgi:hypothetical protein
VFEEMKCWNWNDNDKEAGISNDYMVGSDSSDNDENDNQPIDEAELDAEADDDIVNNETNDDETGDDDDSVEPPARTR